MCCVCFRLPGYNDNEPSGNAKDIAAQQVHAIVELLPAVGQSFSSPPCF